MKKQLLILAILFVVLITENCLGQGVGINNPVPALSAMLDVTATNKGILIPRVALTATNAAAPVVAPLTSLLVYNTAVAGAAPNNVTPGYYYWNGVQWLRLSPGNEAWTTIGNSGTSAATNFIGTTDNVDMVVRTNNSEKMRVTSTGNAGIGTVLPASRLHVVKNGISGVAPDANAVAAFENNGTSYLNILSPSTNENGILFGIGGGFTPSAASGGIIYNNSAMKKGFQFRTDGNNTKMVLDSNGKAGLGILSPLAKLDVFVSTSADTIIYRGRNNSASGTINQIGSIEWFKDFNNTIDFNNNVNSAQFAINLDNNAAHDLQLAFDDAAKPGTNTWTIASDGRLKDDVQSFKDGLETINQINPVYYSYNGKGGTPSGEYYVGVIAQDLQKVTPYMVGSFEYTPNSRDINNRETYLDVNNGALTYVLVNSVKELNAKTEKLSGTVKSVTDFGTAEIISGNEVTVNFSEDFSASFQNAALPVVTATPVNSNMQISISNITSAGFTIVADGNAQNLSINWIAAAKISSEQLRVAKNYTAEERQQLLQKVKMKNSTIRTSEEDAEMTRRSLSK